MDELITINFPKKEIKTLLNILENSISGYLEIMQDNVHEINSEPFVDFLEAVQKETDIYIKLSNSIKPPEEEE